LMYLGHASSVALLRSQRVEDQAATPKGDVVDGHL
jgi:hypothetical protein